jgi:hypothetical protein
MPYYSYPAKVQTSHLGFYPEPAEAESLPVGVRTAFVVFTQRSSVQAQLSM